MERDRETVHMIVYNEHTCPWAYVVLAQKYTDMHAFARNCISAVEHHILN